MESVIRIDPTIREKMNIAYTLRRIPPSSMHCLMTGVRPQAGDVVLARITRLGHHQNLQLPNRARKRLFVGDYVVVAYANRYASSQFEALVPKDLGPCQLIAGGGCAGTVLNQNSAIRRGATQLEPLGLVCESEVSGPINVAGYALPPLPQRAASTPLIAVVGSDMDSGKTTTAAYLVRGASQAGLRIGYAKVSGTGASGDPGFLLDAGAAEVVDFTDAGYPSTYLLPPRVCEGIFQQLVNYLELQGVDGIVVEVADGLLQKETAALLATPVFRRNVDAVLLATGDAMSARCGKLMLDDWALPVAGFSGAIECSPLQRREAAEATGLPFIGCGHLATPEIAAGLFRSGTARRAVAEFLAA